jgi:hypothetical protein
MSGVMNTRTLRAGLAAVIACGGVRALADPPAAPPADPSAEPTKAPASEPPAKDPPRDDEPPGLDELLGLTPSGAGKSGLPDTMKSDLDRRLSAEQLGDLFKDAVALMGDASKRLVAAVEASKARSGTGTPAGGESGLATQRIQEDVIRKLDALIAQAEQQQGGSSSKSRSREQQPDPSQPQQQQRSSQQPRDRRNGNGTVEHDGPPQRPGEMSPELEAARAAWGALPDRVRDMLQQGSGDKYSSLYERLTADYYKRLAEQGRRGGTGSGGVGAGASNPPASGEHKP